MSDELTGAAAAVATTQELVDAAARSLAGRASVDGRISVSALDEHQVVAYDLAHAASAVAGCKVMLGYAQHGDFEASLAFAYIVDAIADVGARIVGREDAWGVELSAMAPAQPFVAKYRDPAFLESVADSLPSGGTGAAHLPEEFDLVRDSFHRFAADKIRPVAEHIHRANDDIPESIIEGMAELGGFGLSVPEEYGGFAAGGESDYLAMCVATEELSWGSLGAGGALDHPARDPHPRHRQGRDRGTEARVAAPDRDRRARRRRDGDRAGLRVGRRGREGVRDPVRRRVRAERREDVVHVRGSRRHPHGPRPHRPRPLARSPRALRVRRRQTSGARPPLRLRRRRGREDGGARHRHPRLPGDALLRGGLRRVARAHREPRRPRRRPRQGLLPADGGLRERAAPDRGALPSV